MPQRVRIARWAHATLVAALATAAALAPSPLAAQRADTTHRDSSRVAREPLFTGRDALYAGGFAIATVAMFPLDRRIAREFQRPNIQGNHALRNVATDFRLAGNPGTLIVGAGLYTIGRVRHLERVADIGLHGTEAIAIAEAINFAVKGVAGRARPYAVADTNPGDFAFGRGFRKGDDYQSFPSGHAVAGFAAAAAVTSEAARLWPRSTWFVAPVMYGGATMVGLSRLYNNKHWASDVAMAAGIGTLSGITVVRFNHSHPHNLVDRWLLAASIVPVGTSGIAVTWSLAP